MDSPVKVDALDWIWSKWRDASPIHVVDVGANPVEGDPSYKDMLKRGYVQVTGFEPQPEALAELSARGSENECYLPYALGAGGPASLRLFKESGFASLYDLNAPLAELFGWRRGTREVGRRDVSTVRMDEVTGLRSVDFLKIDVQGSELPIIANGEAKLAQAVAVQVEVRFVPLYDGEPTFGELDAELRRQGFMFHDFAYLKRVSLASPSAGKIRWRACRQVVDGDAFYIRDLTRPEAITDVQFFRLALISEGAIRSHTLALYCLETLAHRGALEDGVVGGYLARLPRSVRR